MAVPCCLRQARAGQSSPTPSTRSTLGVPLTTSPSLPGPTGAGSDGLGRPQERYGRQAPAARVRRRLVVAFAVFTVAVLAFAGWVAWDRASAGVSWREVAFAVRSDALTQVTVDVTVAEGRSAVCRLRAMNVGYTEVGLADVPVGPLDGGTTRVTLDLPTSERAVYAEVRSCVPR